jgi:hypothetical protein
LALSKPTIGFAELHIGEITLKGVSYINPFLLFDLRDFVRDMTLGHSCSMDIDCESYGMAHIEYTPSGDIIVLAPDQPEKTYDWNLYANPNNMAMELAHSIEKNLEAWALWKDDDDMTPEDDLKEVKGIVSDLLTYAKVALGDTVYDGEIAHAYLDVTPSQLTEQDAHRLWLDLKDAIENIQSRGAWQGWSLCPPQIQATDNDLLKCCDIKVSGSYFDERGLVFLRNDGLMELAGWADSKNRRPLQTIFAQWATNTSKRHH